MCDFEIISKEENGLNKEFVRSKHRRNFTSDGSFLVRCGSGIDKRVFRPVRGHQNVNYPGGGVGR